MELDEFKMAVRQRRANVWTEAAVSGKETTIRKESRSIIARIKKSLQLEMALTIPFIIFLLLIFYKLPLAHLELFAGVMAGLCFCFTSFIIHLYRKIIHYQSNTTSVRKTLVQIIGILEYFTRLYFMLTVIMVPVISGAAIFAGYASMETFAGRLMNPFSGSQLIILAGVSVAWYVAMYFFTKWYIRKLYGNHLNFLKAQLAELDSE